MASSKSSSRRSPARASSALAGAAAALLLAGCAGPGALTPGISTAAEVEAHMGTPAEKRRTPDGETLFYYPYLPYGHAMYVARIDAAGRFASIEQRLTDENIAKVVPGRTRAEAVRDLLGPPWRPQRFPRMEREVWTYPMRVAGFPTPKWFLVQISPDGVVRETYLIDDPAYHRPDTPRRR